MKISLTLLSIETLAYFVGCLPWSLRLSPLLIPFTTVVAIGWNHGNGTVQCFQENDVWQCFQKHAAEATLIRASLTGFLLAALIWSTRTALAYADKEFNTTWYDRGLTRRDARVTWQGVFELASLDNQFDPITLETNPQIRTKMPCATMVLCLCWISLGFLFAVGFDFIIAPRIPPVFKDKSHAVENLTAYLALLAAAVSIIFTYHQLRAKVRADNRQVWIDKLRVLLTAIISDLTRLNPYWQELFFSNQLTADFPQAWKDPNDHKEYQRLNSNRLLLELMLNPSEKDHRLLTVLIRTLVVPGIKIKGDQAVAEQIEYELQGLKKDLLYRLATERNLPAGVPLPVQRDDWNDSISYIVKLSHVILKREWERVRHTR